MNTIYINQVPVILCVGTTDSLNLPTRERVQLTYHDKTEILPLIQYIENTPELKEVRLVGEDMEQLRADFFSHYTFIHAAGGVVRNVDNELLLIYRNDKWDLPKGKVEANESYEQAALREIAEETGIGNTHIIAPINIAQNNHQNATYHTYYDTNQRVLKITHWYDIYCSHAHPNDLQPQTAEGISEVVWVKSENLLDNAYFENMYSSIRDVLRNFLEKNAKNETKNLQ
ncbi:MAG: NUDIX domain-containing protein [Chitinophagales bacterium]|nr:NUDIX domain-containing protein [Chitinophagales bacterium]